MAEGLVLTKFTSVDDAVAVVAALAQSGEIYVMQQDARIADLEAERDADRAGEARAVEALKVAYEAAEDWHGSVEWEGREYTQAVLDACDAVLADSQPALDWLAQREREAAARELRLLADGCATVNPVLSWQLRACADGLTDQQPTACSRSEVRGKERL
jgi:hypothetical protein